VCYRGVILYQKKIVMTVGVFLDRETLGQDISLKPLSELFHHWNVYDNTRPEQIVERCHNASVVIVNKVVLDEATLKKLPHLKFIGVAATGINNIDLDYAQQLGVKVINVEGYAAPAVAQHCFNLLLQLAGRSRDYGEFIADQGWQRSTYFCHLDYPMMELSGKKFGVVGYGSLGKASAHIAQAFGMEVIISERPNSKNIRAGRHSFEDCLAQSDVVSLHCPLNDSSTEMINASTLATMKSSALLINTSRGGLIDEQALISALKNRQIAGAALDVLSKEPPVNGNVLLEYDDTNLIITPHIAWATVEARTRCVVMLANNINKELSA